MDAAAELGRNPVSKHQIQPEYGEWTGWRGTGRLNPSRDHFPCSADHERDWQPYPVDAYSAICDDHTCIHRLYIHTYESVSPLSHLIKGFRNKYHWSPLGRINASGIEWLGWQGRIARLCVFVLCCVFSSHPFWTSMDVPAGVTQEEGHTGFLIHLPSAVRALIFVARRIQPFLSLVDREVEFCVLTN